MASPIMSNGASSTGGSRHKITVKDRRKRVPHQEKPFPCTYVDCKHRFDTLKEMQRHKKSEPTHHYCKRCDTDCIDWEDLTRHKVREMEPYLSGQKRAKDDPPKHITCELCGEDFESFGGRRRHRAQMHQAAQDIECPGCRRRFELASAFVQHLEDGQCEVIDQNEYRSMVRQKFINHEIMKDPQGTLNRINLNLRSAALPGLITNRSDSTDDGDDDEGGISLLETHKEAQQSGYKPLQPKVRSHHAQSPHEMWPSLVNADQPQLMDLPCPHPESLRPEAQARPSAWSMGVAVQKLFPKSSNPPAVGDWKAFSTRLREESLADEKTNLLKARWWDPMSKDFDVARFYDATDRRYMCPLVDCQRQSTTAGGIESHFEHEHHKNFWTCLLCLKRFDTAHTLMRHAERTVDCKIRHSVHYATLVDQLSGGFLKAEAVSEAKICHRPQQSLTKSEQQPVAVHGVMDTRYKAKMPYEE